MRDIIPWGKGSAGPGERKKSKEETGKLKGVRGIPVGSDEEVQFMAGYMEQMRKSGGPPLVLGVNLIDLLERYTKNPDLKRRLEEELARRKNVS